MQRITTCTIKPPQLAETPIVNKKSKHNFWNQYLGKLKGYTKIDAFDTFYESFWEIKHFASSKLENFKEENERSRSLETKIQL